MFEGCYTALITPFANGKIDFDALARLIEFQIAGGVRGVVPCGTSGESATLSEAEHNEVVEFTVQKVKKRVQVLAGTGSNCTETSVRLTRHAESAGADGALLITPYYNKPTQEGLYQHYRTVAEATALPMVLYNVPGRTAVSIQPETVARLATDCKNIIGLKDATNSLVYTSEVLARVRGLAFDLLSGDDGVVLPQLSVGAKGVISVLSNISPRSMVTLVAAWQKGDIATAQKLHYDQLDLCLTLFIETSPVPVKTAAALLGFGRDEVRLPLVPMSEANKKRLVESMRAFGLAPGTA
jgi:4-hydroxy-tetrahydrodipicolinate synthase